MRAVATVAAAAGATPVVGPLLAAAAGAGMYAALTGMMGGFGLGKFNFNAPAEGTMTQPVSPYATNQESEKAVAESTKTPIVNLNANIQVGTEGWAKQTMLSLQQHHGTTIR
jgi:hypothetical protein